jgi:hypothetical protein
MTEKLGTVESLEFQSLESHKKVEQQIENFSLKIFGPFFHQIEAIQ